MMLMPGSTTLAEAFFLVSPWKPLVIFAIFIPWLVVLSRTLDKHAKKYFLGHEKWNTLHLSIGLVALAAAFAIPMKSELSFWLGAFAAVVILVADVAVFMLVTNKDERVPEKYRLTVATLLKGDDKPKAAKKVNVRASEVVIKGPDKATVAVPSDDNADALAVRASAENMWLKANSARASELDIGPSGREGAYMVAFTVDGIRVPGELREPEQLQVKEGQPQPLPPGIIPTADAIKVIDFWKAAAKLDLADRRKKQQGDITIERGTTRQKLRISTLGAQGGVKLGLIFDPELAVRRKWESLGLLESQATALQAMVDEGKGLILLSGPADSGRTTTMYSIVKRHDAYTRNVQTVEMEIQDALEGVRQTKFEANAEGAEYSTLVRSILRRDPDVLAIAEIPDANTAREVSKTDWDRVRVYVSLPAISGMEAIQKWIHTVGDADAAVKGLRGVVSQRVIRKLCTNCRVAYQPTPDMIKRLGLPADRIKQLFKKGGQVMVKNRPETCPVCSGGGYVGLDAAFEVLPIGDAERTLLRAKDLAGFKQEIRKKNLPMIAQAALKKALDGVTSVEEVQRATSDGQAPVAAAPAAAGAAPAAAAKPAPAKG